MSPSPLWPELATAADLTERRSIDRPAILRFAADTFMEDLFALLEKDPGGLTDLIARPETWRSPILTPKAAALIAPDPPTSAFARRLQRLRRTVDRAQVRPAAGSTTDRAGAPAFKLYQPAHQRYYIVTASFVCRVTGLPDRVFNTGTGERSGFVVRRLVDRDPADPMVECDPARCDEYALVITPRGGVWHKVGPADAAATAVPVTGEERLPLFPLHFVEDDGRHRRVLGGLVPVARREAYQGAPSAASPDGGGDDVSASDPRMIELYGSVTEPWKQLIALALETWALLTEPPDPNDPTSQPPPIEAEATRKKARSRLQTVSWYILLDFAKFLESHLPDVWQHLMAGTTPGTPAQAAEKELIERLRSAVYIHPKPDGTPGDTAMSLADALKEVGSWKDLLESVTEPYDEEDEAAASPPNWPVFRFSFAEPKDGTVLTKVMKPGTEGYLETANGDVDELADLIRRLLPRDAAGILPPPPLIAQPPLDARDGWFVLRCVFERPSCGPIAPPVVSPGTEPFQMAGFFDPDAPARPIRIGLPLDISPAGLRRFDKNAAFMISDMLCGQIDRVKGLTFGDLVRSVLPWPFHKNLQGKERGPCQTPGGSPAGMMCTLSIPIITICALILLLIMVKLFDIIFRWLPYFLVCFPLPGFRGKKP